MAKEFHNLVNDCTMGSTAQELHSQNRMKWFSLNDFIIICLPFVWGKFFRDQRSIVVALPPTSFYLSALVLVWQINWNVVQSELITQLQTKALPMNFHRLFLQKFLQWPEEIAYFTMGKYMRVTIATKCTFYASTCRWKNLCLAFSMLFRRILFNLIYLSYFVSFWTFNAQHSLERERHNVEGDSSKYPQCLQVVLCQNKNYQCV